MKPITIWNKIFASLARRNAEPRSHRDIFSAIYRDKRWGGRRAMQLDFCSGGGSFPEATGDYEALVADFVQRNAISRIVDLGCGDFQVAERILGRLPQPPEYVGVDVVPALIARNTERFGRPGVSFVCLDAANDPLPDGDLVLIREVLQHLSNDAVSRILDKVQQAPFAIITNAVSGSARHFNVDVLPGASTRNAIGSALALDQAPFNFPCQRLSRTRHPAFNLYELELETLLYQRPEDIDRVVDKSAGDARVTA